MARGYVLIHRSIFDLDIWNTKPYDKAHAWVDLILLADHEDSEDKRYKRGCVYRGKQWLSIRWGWSVGKVTRFLNNLEELGMVTQCSRQGGKQNGNILTIVNYDKFQIRRKQSDMRNDMRNDMPTNKYKEEPTSNSALPTAADVLYGGYT